jgi:hypothetical protein
MYPVVFQKRWVNSVDLGPILSCSDTRLSRTYPKQPKCISCLLGELERRANAHPEELSALLVECNSPYLSARKRLLVSRLVEEIKGLDLERTELVELVSYYRFLFIFYSDF